LKEVEWLRATYPGAKYLYLGEDQFDMLITRYRAPLLIKYGEGHMFRGLEVIEVKKKDHLWIA